MGYSAAIGNP